MTVEECWLVCIIVPMFLALAIPIIITIIKEDIEEWKEHKNVNNRDIISDLDNTDDNSNMHISNSNSQ